MDTTVLFDDLTEWELKKYLDLKIQKLQEQNLEAGSLHLELANTDFVEGLLNKLAYRYVASGGLSDSDIKCEIEKIMEEASKGIPENSILLGESIITEESSPKSDSYNFDDTMEEMERLLKDGFATGDENSESNEDADVGTEMVNKLQEGDVKFKDLAQENVSVISVEQLSCNYSRNYENGQHSIKSETFSTKSTESEQSMKNGVNNSPFKLPDSSVKKEVLNSGKFHKPEYKMSTPVNKLYKDIISPVAFYIKNSGTTPARRNLKFTPEKHLYRNEMNESIYCTSMQNNQFPCARDVILPEVFYIPSAVKQFISKERSTKLPNSLNKLVEYAPEIIIHEHRIKKGEQKPDIHTRNTDCSFVAEDVSIYITKHAEIH